MEGVSFSGCCSSVLIVIARAPHSVPGLKHSDVVAHLVHGWTGVRAPNQQAMHLKAQLFAGNVEPLQDIPPGRRYLTISHHEDVRLHSQKAPSAPLNDTRLWAALSLCMSSV